MTDSVDSYIKNTMMDNIYFDDRAWIVRLSFDDIFNKALHNIYNVDFNDDDGNTWIDYEKPSLDEFMIVQQACYEYLKDCDFLDEITEKKRDWKWWYNIYALSKKWCDDMEELEKECFNNIYEEYIIELQSNIRRRQATIRTIRKLHLTGTL